MALDRNERPAKTRPILVRFAECGFGGYTIASDDIPNKQKLNLFLSIVVELKVTGIFTAKSSAV